MVTDRPELVSKELESLLRTRDIDAVVDLYEDDAAFADFAGAVHGAEAIRAAHEAFLASGSRLTLGDSVVFEANDLALVHWSWQVERDDGTTIDGVSAEVLRRQADGSWKFVIDNSDGAAMLGVL